MKPRWDYLIKPQGKEYNNTKKIAGLDFVVNATIEDAKFVNRLGIVCASPKESEIKKGSVVVVHHNVFRTYLDMKGNKRKSNEYFRDDLYLVPEERIYMYDDGSGWKPTKDFCFISPIEYNQDGFLYRSDKQEEEHVGIINYIKDDSLKINDKIGFTKNSEYQFTIDKKKLYRMTKKDICAKLM